MTGIAAGLEWIGIPSEFSGTLESIILFVLGFIVLYAIGKAVIIPIVQRLIKRRKLDEHAQRPILKITSFLVFFGAITLAFGVAGWENFLFAFAGIAAAGTLAIGFAMQNAIKNFVSGIFIYIDEPFRIGDWIEWDDNIGVVEDIRLRTTRVKTFDNEQLTVPNAELTENVVKNPVAKDRIRQRFTVGIGFDDDVIEASQIMIEAAEAHEEILSDPEPQVRLTELGDSAVILQARFWIDDPKRSDFIRIRGEYGATVKSKLQTADVNIPFPIRTLGGRIEIAGELDAVSN